MSKRFRRRRNGKKKTDGTKALKLVRTIMRATEIKYIRNQATTTNLVDWNGGIASLNEINRGTGDLNNRIGDKIQPVKVLFNMSIFQNSLAVFSTHCRIILFWDKQSKVVNVNDLMSSTTLGTNIAPLSLVRFDKRFQVNILLDRLIRLDHSSPVSAIIRKTITLKNKFTQFNENSLVINTGALKMILISDEETNAPNMLYDIRVLFNDS